MQMYIHTFAHAFLRSLFWKINYPFWRIVRRKVHICELFFLSGYDFVWTVILDEFQLGIAALRAGDWIGRAVLVSYEKFLI